MAKIERFEEIKAWQKAIELNDLLYEVTERFPFARDFSLKDQMKRSCLSVSSNITEGFERESNNSFIYYLRIAKGSAGEFRSQLYVAKSRNYISDTEFQKLYGHAEETSKMIGGFIGYLRKLKLKTTIKTIVSIFTLNYF
jgi:four helix bundle protein